VNIFSIFPLCLSYATISTIYSLAKNPYAVPPHSFEFFFLLDPYQTSRDGGGGFAAQWVEARAVIS
jgi:hypothetical protein